MQYDKETLNTIESSVNLLEYIAQTHSLKQVGTRYFLSCSKHTDNTPSLCINPDTNTFHCFSCNRSGSIIQYLRDYEGYSFSDAVEKATKLGNVDLSKMCQSKTISFLREYGTNTESPMETESKKIILPESSLDRYPPYTPIEWIDEGILPSVMRLFDIRLDLSGNRIVYPVRDESGRLINIKGRTRYVNYKEMGLQKYTNYYKLNGEMDYFQGMDIAKPYIEEQGEVIIFESIKSVMKLFGWGYFNAVSAEKHSLTNSQINLLIKMHVNVVIAFDSDVDRYQPAIQGAVNTLKRVTNVYWVNNRDLALGGVEAKASPADMGSMVWKRLFEEKKHIR